ncbi:hypothetical protein BH09BAC1_BH09BAC1_02800 [soil metagenome]
MYKLATVPEPKVCTALDMLRQKLNYIHNNPVEAGFVYRPEDYPWSSAIDYAGGKGRVDVVQLGVIKV